MRRLNRPAAYTGMALGAVVVLGALAAGLRPPSVISVAEWSEAERRVAPESGSPYPGKWRNSLVPYGIEIMECLSPAHPCREVTFAKSHQVAGTEFGVNLFGYMVDREPCPIVIVLPTIDESKKYDRVKLQPTIEATPALHGKVRADKSRDEKGSTMAFKRFRGGYCQLTGANTSTGLQMISGRILIAEEISEWPEDAGNRGDPLTQAEKRLTAWARRGQKRYYSSTPKIKGTCRITAKYEASDQRRYYVACPHCGVYQVLVWNNMKRHEETRPYGAYYACAANGCVIEHFEKERMVAAGVWIKTYPDGGAEPGPTIGSAQIESYRARDGKGREPGFHIWQAYSPFVDWDDTTDDWLNAQGNPYKEKVFVQQDLGEAYEESGETPDHEKLFLRRETYPLGQIPAGALVLTGMADVQSNRIEWAVYGWGIGMTGWLIDKGLVEGDPAMAETWKAFAPVVERRYEDWQGKLWPADAYGVDAGYLSNMVYNFTRTRPRTFALDGRAGHLHPLIGTPRPVEVTWQGKKIKGGAMLWPTGTWQLKSAIYAALRQTIEGPDEDGVWPLGCLHSPDACDREHFKQLTAEYLFKVEKKDRVDLEWRKIAGQANEQLDIAVGARALAAKLGLDNYSAGKWRALAEERGAPPETMQRELAELWTPAQKPKAPRGAANTAAPRRLAQLNR